MKNAIVKVKFDMGGFNIDPVNLISKLVHKGMIEEFSIVTIKDLEFYEYNFQLKKTDLHYVMEQSIMNSCTFFQFENCLT